MRDGLNIPELPAILESDLRLPFVPLYMLLLEYADGDIQLAKREERKGPLIATEQNQYLLREIGDRLLRNKLIIGYQLAKTLTVPTRNPS